MSWFRKPRTIQELRANAGACALAKPRAKRCNIPTAWDDMQSRHERSWKSHRVTQYKGGAACSASPS